MKVCRDCRADISLTCHRTRYCPTCVIAHKRNRHAERTAKKRALVPWVPRAVRTQEMHDAMRGESVAEVEALLAEAAARRRRQRMTLSDDDCWAGAGSMAGAWEGAEA